MSKITSKFWMFGKQNEPADDFDSDYDTIYYGEKPAEESAEDAYNDDAYAQDDISEVKVVTETEPVAESEAPAEAEVEEEPLYKVILAPESCQDSAEIVECFKMGRVVIIDAEALPKEDFFRMFDYVMGAVHALDGELEKVTKNLVVLWPAGVDTSLDIDEIEDEPYEEYDEEEIPEDEEA